MFPAENAQLDVPVEEFKWEIPVSSTNVGPTFYVTTDKMFVLLQMIYTTINSWSPSVQLTARVYGVDGTKKFSTISESASSFIMSQDSYSANCGPMAVTKLQDDNGNLVYQVTYDTPELKVDITHTSLSKSFQLGTGQHLFDDNDQDQGYVKSKFLPRAKAVGKIIVDGVESECSGFSCLTFVTQHIPQGIALWNFCDFQAKDHALMLYQVYIILNVVSLASGKRKIQSFSRCTTN